MTEREIFLATVAEPLAPIIKGATELVNDLTGKLVDWNRAHPKLTAAIIGTVVVLGTLAIGVGSLLLLAGLLTKGVLAAVSAASGCTVLSAFRPSPMRSAS